MQNAKEKAYLRPRLETNAEIEKRLGCSLSDKFRELTNEQLGVVDIAERLGMNRQQVDRRILELGLVKQTVLIDPLHEVIMIKQRRKVDEPQIQVQEHKEEKK
tara:strand:+ start:254 stop:562 length:309 start_codon:yes stop_codon:yes gene_type:complete